MKFSGEMTQAKMLLLGWAVVQLKATDLAPYTDGIQMPFGADHG